MRRTFIIAAGALALGAGGILSSTLFWPGSAQSGGDRLSSAQLGSDQSTTIRTATFKVENLFCALCPVTVKTAMEGVEGVRSVDVDFGTKIATVVFDPSVTNSDAIAAASTGIGYPARETG